MPKKMMQEETKPTQNEEPETTDGAEGLDPSDALGALNFDVENEYKPDPLMAKQTYHGVVTKVALNAAQFAIVWTVCLQDNGGTMNDGNTPIDGACLQFKNWLPKPGDETTMTASGKNTKRQSKINQLKDFETAMAINMSTPQIIAQALNEAIWVGMEVDVDVDVEEWNSKFRNTINRMRRRQY